MMLEKGHKNKFETDFDFHEFFFKSIAHNDQEVTEKDLDVTLMELGMSSDYAKNTDKII